MNRARRVLASILAGIAMAASAADPEVARLLERAEFWQARERDDLARDELAKLLRLVPDNAEGLAQLARIQLRANQDRDAQATLEKLRAAHPKDPAVAKIATALRIRGPDREKLRQARQLGRAGRRDEAVEAYRALFPDGFPDEDLELEFARTLAGTQAGREAGSAQIAALARRHPDDPRYRVALATDLGTRKPVAAATLRELGELSAVPAVARQALEAWRRALLALDPVEASVAPLREYVKAKPGDTAIEEKLAQVTRAVAEVRRRREDPGLIALREGVVAMEAGRLEAAEQLFARAASAHPDDPETLNAQGLLRMRQGRHGEAIGFFERALRRDPAGSARWMRLVRTARYWELLRQAGSLRAAGALDQAAAKVREAHTLDPAPTGAAAELVRIHLAAGRVLEAEAALAELPPDERAPLERQIRASRASVLRDKARAFEAQGRRDDAIALLEEASGLDPDSPWVAHDLARLYALRGEGARGDALFARLIERRPRDPDVRYAMALFLSSAEREPEALAALDSIPLAERSDNMTRLQHRLWVSIEGRRAAELAKAGRKDEADRVMAGLRQRIGDDLALALEVARAFDRLGNDAEVRRIVDRFATAPGATDEQREAIAELRESLSARAAQSRRSRIDALLDAGDLAGARSVVDAALAEKPDDARVLAQASRVAERQGDVDRAVAYEQRSLALEPSEEPWRTRRFGELRDQQLGWLGAGLDSLYRSGSGGKARVEAEELVLGYRGRWSPAGRGFVRVAPVRVASGNLDLADAFEVSTFGSMLLCQPLCTGPMPRSSEKGVSFTAGMETGPWRLDAGTTPLGFPVANLVGGALYKGDLGPFGYSIDVSRRALASSQLSYAGMRDPNTGRTWGGVVATGVRLNASRDSGGDYGAWALAGLYRLTGRNVKSNDKAEAMAGAYRRFVNEEDRQLVAGLTTMLWRFSENSGEYTFGHGGYYSPKSYASLAFPVTFSRRTADTSFSLRASVSVSTSQSRRAPYFPTDPDLQARAEALATAGGSDPFYAGGNNGRGFGRSLAAVAEHRIAPNVFVGARLELERSTNYTPNRLLLYVRMSPNGDPQRPIALPPEPVVLPGFQY